MKKTGFDEKVVQKPAV